MISVERLKACANPACREVLPADPEHPEWAGFYVDRRDGGRVKYFKGRCKRCCSAARVRPPERRYHRVHVAVVDGVERHVKYCPGCGQEKVAEADAPDSGFYTNRASGYVTFYRLCKACVSSKRKRARREDPRFREMETATRRRWAEKNPERLREAQRDWHRRYRAAHPEEVRELQRISYRLRAERRGIKPIAGWPKVIDGTRPEEAAPPFVAWLRAYQRARDLPSAEALARELGLVNRRVRSLLAGEQQRVSVAACCPRLVTCTAAACTAPVSQQSPTWTGARTPVSGC